MGAGAVRKRIHEARNFAVDLDPICGGGTPKAGRMRDRGKVQNQIGRPAEGRVHDHGIPNRGIGQDIFHADAASLER